MNRPYFTGQNIAPEAVAAATLLAPRFSWGTQTPVKWGVP
jgi:hypothetical protein